MNQELVILELKKLRNSYNDMISNSAEDISEEKIRSGFLNKVLELFGWDLSNLTEIIEEKKIQGEARKKLIEINSKHVKPDYQLLDRGVLRMYLDAKTAPKDFRESKGIAFQIRSYGWSSNLPISIVSNFEYFSVYDTSFKPNPKMNASFKAFSFSIDELINDFDKYSQFLSKSIVQKGNWNLEEFGINIEDKNSRSLDSEFLKLISDFRISLGNQLLINAPTISVEHLNYFVQVITNRIVFVRILEDLGYEPYQKLLSFVQNSKGFWKQFQSSSQNEFFDRYDGALFEEKLNINSLSDKAFTSFINELYGDTPYRFDVISPSIIAEIYDMFLGKQIVIKSNKIVVQQKLLSPSGSVPTPSDISKFICERVLNLDEITNLDEIKKIKLIDPCVGSGSFLVSAFELIAKKIQKLKMVDLLDYHELKNIIINNLFGVDIDPVALEVLKMTISIRLVTSDYKKVEPVKNLLSEFSSNFKLGNSVVEIDNRSKLLSPKEVIYQIPTNYADLFPDIFEHDSGFTHLVSNPPYIEPKHFKEHFPETLTYLKERYISNKGKSDVSMFFLERFFELVNENGKVGTMIQNRFFKADYGVPLRKFLSERGYLTEIIEYKSNRLFRGKTTYVATMFGSKMFSKNIRYGYSKNDINKTRANLYDVISEDNQQITLKQNELMNSATWSFSNFAAGKIYRELLENKSNNFFTLNSTEDMDIIVGPQVLDSKFFLVKDVEKSDGNTVFVTNRRDESIEIESDMVRRVLRNDQLTSFTDFTKVKDFDYMIFPYEMDGTFISENEMKVKFPLAYQYFQDMFRESKTKKRADKGEFYRFTREQNHNSYSKAKIFIPMTHKKVVASFCNVPMFGDNSNVNAVVSKVDNTQKLKALCALMNSKIFSLLAIPVSGEASGDYRKLNKQFLGEVIIPELTKDRIYNLAKIYDDIIYEIGLYNKRYGESLKISQKDIFRLQKRLESTVESYYGISKKQVASLETIVSNVNIYNSDLDWVQKYK